MKGPQLMTLKVTPNPFFISDTSRTVVNPRYLIYKYLLSSSNIFVTTYFFTLSLYVYITSWEINLILCVRSFVICKFLVYLCFYIYNLCRLTNEYPTSPFLFFTYLLIF